MIHENLEVKEFLVKEGEAFRMSVRSWEVISPKGLLNVDFIQESLDKEGKVAHTSTYNFFMTKEDIKTLCEGLLAE